MKYFQLYSAVYQVTGDLIPGKKGAKDTLPVQRIGRMTQGGYMPLANPEKVLMIEWPVHPASAAELRELQEDDAIFAADPDKI